VASSSSSPLLDPQVMQKLPKVDLHRHLEGSLRLRTIMEIARRYGLTVPISTAELRPLVEVTDTESHNFRNFLSKFQTLRLFYRSPEIISRVTYEAIADAAADGLVYLELLFTPIALARAQGFAMKDVMDWVVASAGKAARECDIKVSLIACINRHEPLEIAEEITQLSVDRMSAGLCGLDLAGNEVEFPASPFLGLFKQAKASGLHISVHAGEWGEAENVRYAIEKLGAERIGHGIHILEDASVTALASERGIPFTVCLTSNVQTGAVASLSTHPLPRMLQAGLNVTLNTDDPSISQINLSSEYRLALQALGLSQSVLYERVLAAAEAAFIPETERQIITAKIKTRTIQV
jgi:adenosine deaminase